tara:strand:- start:1897 stop:2877 length:981 start_codon:yes stop_codon:yes gene_type:complete
MKSELRIRIGVIGVGHLGDFHLKQLKTISNILISGIYDNDINRAEEISKKYNVQNHITIKSLLANSDAISIVTPTSTHFSIAINALKQGCHVFIEKPITDNIYDANTLIKKAKELNKIIQVGHIERFNPAFNYIKNLNLKPQFIESHRLSQFNSRGNDVPVLLDLMIHDLDLILSLVKSNIKNIRANGIKIVSSTIDMANARIEFENKCIANLTASRISQKNMRKMRLFQEEEYITIDFQTASIEEYKVCDMQPNIKNSDKIIEINGEHKKQIIYKKPKIKKYDALKIELEHFIHSINNFSKPETDGESATRALSVALEIHNIINI